MRRLPPLFWLILLIALIEGAYIGYQYFKTHSLSFSGEDLATTTPPIQGDMANKRLDEQGDFYTIRATYPLKTPLKESAGVAADARIVTIMETFERNAIESFKERGNFTQLTEEDINVQGLGGDRKYTLDITYDFYESPKTISYVFTLYEDTLGAHGNGYFRTFTFDKNTGEGLVLADLFDPNTEYLSVISEETRKRLAIMLGENRDQEYLENGTTPYEENFIHFALEGSDLLIIFPPYQVGPYALGPQTVAIPRGGLADILKPHYR